jgi:TPR repeat protein
LPKDDGMAVQWYRKAAAQGHGKAAEALKQRGTK